MQAIKFLCVFLAMKRFSSAISAFTHAAQYFLRVALMHHSYSSIIAFKEFPMVSQIESTYCALSGGRQE